MEVFKEPAITWRFIGWTEDWEKEEFKDSGAVARAMFINKYKDTIFIFQILERLTMLMMVVSNFSEAEVEGGLSTEIQISQV